MPRYDYKCNDCNKNFELSLSLKELDDKDSKKKMCPECQSSKIEKLISRGSGGILKRGVTKSIDSPASCGSCCSSGGGCPYSG